MSASPFDKVPDELILEIFSHLSLSDRKRTRLVCSRFRNINAEFSLMEKDVLVQRYATLNTCISPYFTYYSVRTTVYDYEFNDSHVEFWDNYGAEIKTLFMHYRINNDLKVLVDIFNRCPNLQNLTLWLNDHLQHDYCDCEIFNLNTSKLISLKIFGCYCSEQLRYLLEGAVKLEVFNISIENTDMVADPLFTFLEKQAPLLREVQLYSAHADAIFSLTLPFFSEPEMTKLVVQSFGIKTDLDAVGNFFNLKELSLDIIMDISEEALSQVLRRLTNLTHLTLLNAKISDINATTISSIPFLSSLSLLRPSITRSGFKKLFGAQLYPKMKYIFIHKPFILSDSKLSGMLANFPNLESLRLSNCPELKGKFIKDISVTNFKLFEMHNCSRVKLNKFITLINSMSQLNVLALHGSDNNVIKFDWPLFQLKELRILATIFTSKLLQNETYLTTVFNNCPKLEYIIDIDKESYRFELQPDLPIFAFAVENDLKKKRVKFWSHNMFCVTK